MEALNAYRADRKAGRLTEAVGQLRLALPGLDAGSLAQAGKMLMKDLQTALPDARPLKVLVLGQCTTSYLPAVITAWSWAEGMSVTVRDGEYDQVVQTLMAMSEAPDVLVLLPWHQRLLAADARGAEARIADEMAFMRAVWGEVARLRCKLVQVGHDWTSPGSTGFSLGTQTAGEIDIVRRVNAATRAALPAGAFFIDLESISGWLGRARCYDDRNYHWLKQPFTPEGLSLLGHHIATALRVLTSGRRKVLVLDLDNTVWGGVVGEAGPHGIEIGGTTEGEAFAAFQKQVKRLKDSGVLLAACSKNNDADAREPFEKNDRMILRLDDFAAFHASWDSKPARLRQIAHELNVGLDSLVFFDDNPAEREHVSSELPEVTVIEVPQEPALYVRALVESLAFETVALNAADAERSAQYAAEAARRGLESGAASSADYLASLEMVAEIVRIGEDNLDRVVDLITKTNQFNLTTRRHSRAAVEEMLRTPRSVCFAVRLADKFGDYGLISVVLAMPDEQEEKTLRLDTWLMSCRAMGRTVEYWVVNRIVAAAKMSHYLNIVAEYLPTAKNTPVRELLPGFQFRPDAVDGNRWRLELKHFKCENSKVQDLSTGR